MLRIPFTPTAYPDEMLASLLARLKLHNGPGLWYSLLEESGYRGRNYSPFFNPPEQDAKLERLLAALGYTYPMMLRELTVLPFWLSFNQATPVKNQIHVDAASGRLTSLSRLGHAEFLRSARYCPACIRDDIAAHGEPYLHRQHQLRVASVCASHGVALRSSCPACGLSIMPFNNAHLRPPPLRCECGEDLSRIAGPLPANQQAMMRLSQFAADTLSCTEAPWTQSQVLAVLYERLDKKQQSFRSFATQLLQDTYGPPDKTRSRTGPVLTWEDVGSTLRVRIGGGPSTLRAPEYCALLAASGFTFDAFREAVSQIEAKSAPAKAQRHPLTIEVARQEYERFAAKSSRNAPSLLRNNSPKLFWLLHLRDNAYMRAYGYRSRTPTPTIDADREEIDKLLRGPGERLPRNHSARIRASIRDLTWLQSRIQAPATSQISPQMRANHAQQENAVALSRAVFSVLRTQSRPERIHTGMLVKIVHISMRKAYNAIAQTPALKLLIGTINADKDRRRAFWAARGLASEGRHPTSQEVLKRAGLVPTRPNRHLCIQAIAVFTPDFKIVQSK